eukprot:10853054-Karenia_brevis.AAC.1
MHHQHSLGGYHHQPAMHHQHYSLCGRQRRKIGINNMKAKIKELQADLKTLQTQCGLLTDILGEQFTAGHASPALHVEPTGHASPELFDLYDSDDSLATADHASP